TTAEAVQKLKVDDLKALIRLLGHEPPARKPELAALVLRVLTQPEQVRALYEQLDETGQAALQEATHDPEGLLDLSRFVPKYGRAPDFGKPYGGYGHPARPSILRLFFPQ